MGKPTMWFLNRPDTNQPVQSQKRASRLKFRIEVEEALYCSSSENKGADQLRSSCEADLRLCFCLCRLLVFPCGGSNMSSVYVSGSGGDQCRKEEWLQTDVEPILCQHFLQVRL